MSSERIQRRIEHLLDQAKAAADRNDREASRQFAEDVLALDPRNDDARTYLISDRQLGIDNLLDQAKAAADRDDWKESRQLAELVLATDPDNPIAQSYVLDAAKASIEQLLDQVEEAADRRDWEQVLQFSEEVLAIDQGNVDAKGYRIAALRKLDSPPEGSLDELQIGTYEIEVHTSGPLDFSSTGIATVNGKKFTNLPKREFAILLCLYQNRGRVVDIQQLIAESSSSLSSYRDTQAKKIILNSIRSLRRQIEEDPSDPKIILDVGRSGDRYIISPSFVPTVTVLDTVGISLPELPEETDQELARMTAVESTGREEPVGRQGSRSDPTKETKPVIDQEPRHPIGLGQTEDYRKPPEGAEGFYWHWGILKRILLIAVVGLIFGSVGQIIAAFVVVADIDASAVFLLIGYIIGGIIGNMLYDRGVG